MTLTITIGVPVTWRARMATWRERGRHARQRVKRNRHALISAALIVAGLAGGLGFASLIGTWCLGLAGIAESAGAVWFGLMRDDGQALPRRGERTVQDILAEHARLP